MTTKKERQNEWKDRHIATLRAMGFTGSFRYLRTLENRAHYAAERYCNDSRFTSEDMEKVHEDITASVAKMFGGNVPEGFFVNNDPRGYALKIDNEKVTIPAGLHTDLGGYGILAPDFDYVN